MTTGPVPRLHTPLTAREAEVLRLLANGHSLTAIALKTYLGSWTVRKARASMRAKLGARSDAQAVHRAHHLGVLS